MNHYGYGGLESKMKYILYILQDKGLLSYYEDLKECAETLKLLRGCSDIEIKGVNKGLPYKVKLNEYVIRMLCEPLREYIAITDFIEPEDMGSVFIPEDYVVSDERVEEVISDCDFNIRRSKDLKGDAKMGFVCTEFLYLMERCGGIHIKRGNIQKPYSFIYDCFVVVGKASDKGDDFQGPIAKEKYECIRNKINEYKRKMKSSVKK